MPFENGPIAIPHTKFCGWCGAPFMWHPCSLRPVLYGSTQYNETTGRSNEFWGCIIHGPRNPNIGLLDETQFRAGELV